jgi:hypothetical protein
MHKFRGWPAPQVSLRTPTAHAIAPAAVVSRESSPSKHDAHEQSPRHRAIASRPSKLSSHHEPPQTPNGTIVTTDEMVAPTPDRKASLSPLPRVPTKQPWSSLRQPRNRAFTQPTQPHIPTPVRPIDELQSLVLGRMFHGGKWDASNGKILGGRDSEDEVAVSSAASCGLD